jgi:Tfp pilus assembly protein PilO
MSQSTKTALAVLVTVLLAGAFWVLLISPKKDKADELSSQVSALRTEVATAKHETTAGLVAKHNFPHNYQQLILLGKAVPPDSGTASLVVQIDHISTQTKTPFLGIELKESEAEESEAEAAETVASLPPLGSGVGPAGLRAMPYELTFVGGFFDAADFIQQVNSLVQTKNGRLYANGRLLTFDHFEIVATRGPLAYKDLDVKFFVNAYATPAGQGLTAGASPAGPTLE